MFSKNLNTKKNKLRDFTDKIFFSLQKNNFETLLHELLNFGDYLIAEFPDKKLEDISKNLETYADLPSYELNNEMLSGLGAMSMIATTYYSNNDDLCEKMVSQGDYSLLRTYEAWKKAVVIFANFVKKLDSNKNDLYVGLINQVKNKLTAWQDDVIKKVDMIVTLKTPAGIATLIEAEIKQEKKNKEEMSPKNAWLAKLMDKILILQRRGGQHQKLAALFKIYQSFKAINLSDENSINQCKKNINDNLHNIEGFSSPFGKLGAMIKQSFLQSKYTTTMSDTRLLIGKLSEWIEKNAYPKERIRDQILGRGLKS
ncbi:MAG: hypothetical protein JO131_08425 [Gammaproteobacteria bacterium]|nr:hypothetical protein [Gammaproteobacteria bacterium]